MKHTIHLFAVAAIVGGLLAGCSSYLHPVPEDAAEAWHPTSAATLKVDAALAQCRFVDNLTAGEQQILQQAQCMDRLGFRQDLSSFTPENCYGTAPAGCWLWWKRVGMPQPAVVTHRILKTGKFPPPSVGE